MKNEVQSIIKPIQPPPQTPAPISPLIWSKKLLLILFGLIVFASIFVGIQFKKTSINPKSDCSLIDRKCVITKKLSKSYVEWNGKVYWRHQTCFDCGNMPDNLDLLTDADPYTFTEIGNGLAADTKNVYCNYSTKLDTDRNTFTTVGTPSDCPSMDPISKDKNFVYQGCKIIKGPDAFSFMSTTSSYFKDKNTVYYSCNLHPLVDSDPNTFEYINAGYSKDKRYVYYGDKKVEGADPTTFKFP